MRARKFSICLLSVISILVIDIILPAVAEREEMVVTARLREENLQEVPISITALSAQEIENARIVNVDTLANFTTNMSYISLETARTPLPVLRGLGVNDTRGFDNTVGVFVDGVFISGRASQNVEMLDLERVEVIKGPQSALYGRSTFAGAINYVTKKPGNDLDVFVEGTAAEDDYYKILGAVSGPLIKDKLSGRIAVQYDDDDGTYENIGPVDAGSGIDGHEYTTFSGSLRFTPSDTIDIVFDAYYADEDRDSRALSLVDNNCGELAAPMFASDGGQAYTYCGEVYGSSSNKLSVSPEAYSFKSETTRFSLHMDFDFDAFTLTSISSYTDTESLGYLDLDRGQAGGTGYGFIPLAAYQAFGSPPMLFPGMYTPEQYNVFFSTTGLDTQYWSQELRLTSNQDQRLRWQGGVFYMDSENAETSDLDIDVRKTVNATGLPTNQLVFLADLGFAAMPHFFFQQQSLNPAYMFEPFTANIGTPGDWTRNIQEVEQYAVFGSIEYDFTDQLTGTAELRWTSEDRSIENVLDGFFGTPPSMQKDDWDFWDPRFILRYQISDDYMAYASAAHGSRSGGFNSNVTDPNFQSFDEETNWTYELGAKTMWFDNRFQVNAAIFFVDWEDAHFRQRVEGSPGNFLTVVSNSTGISSEGFELEFGWFPIDGLTLSAGYGYNDTEFDNGTIQTGAGTSCNNQMDPATSAFPELQLNCTTDPATGVIAPDISGKQLQRTSGSNAMAIVEYVRPLFGDYELFLRGDASWRDKVYNDHVNNSWVPERTLMNLRAGLLGEKFDVIFWVENLTDEDAPEISQVFNTEFNSQLVHTTAVNISTRRFGVTGRYRFGGD
ncbi:MAG: TonB-dependent receptor [Gammaproteobacteria bacterium]|nr:TonB-dependent receptor [Gammaproteobacteria bacterium]